MAKTDKDPKKQKEKLKPTVSLSGGLNAGKKGGGGGVEGNLNIPIVKKKKTSIDVNLSGGVGGSKSKGGKLYGGGSGNVEISLTRTLGRSKKSNRPKR